MPTLANYELIIWIGHWMPVLWLFIFGCCVGSLINVLAYRLPLGLSVVHPPSACPSCHTHLTWRENIPVLGWLLLRGRCRFCKSKISPQYPIIELFVGLLWATTYALWYCIPDYGPGPFGIPWATLKPDWAKGGIAASWPLLIVYLSLLSSLVAMTLTDLKSFMIPLVLPWFATIVGLIGHTGWSIYIQLSSGSLPGQRPEDPLWSIATPPLPSSGGWWWIGAAGGGTLGLGVGLLLLRFKLVGHSFADYPAWEAEQIAKQAQQAEEAKQTEQAKQLQSAHPASDAPAAQASSSPSPASDLPTKAQPIAAPAAQPGAAEEDPTQLWIAYPHARREMIKEMAFLAPCAALAWAGGWLATRLTGGLDANSALTPGPDGSLAINLLSGPPIPPLWLSVLTGVLMGYLIGGGLVWGVRILGSLGFNKEAMGLGDVHLLAAIGACCGWIDSVLTFFTAAFVGLAWTLVGAIAGGGARRTLPFGPSLAIGCLLVLWAKPFYRWALGRLMHSDGPFGLP